MSVRTTLTALSRPLGLRREVAILVPASLLLLLALVGFTLLSYRSSLDLLEEARRNEALAAARATAEELAIGAPPSAELSSLRRRLPVVRSAVLVDPRGNVLAMSGSEPLGGVLAPFVPRVGQDGPGGEAAGPAAEGAAAADDAVLRAIGDGKTAGTGDALPGAVAAVVPVTLRGAPYLLRVDLEAAVLAGQRRGLRVLSLVVLVVGAGAGMLLVLFLRQLLRPYDAMLARARELSRDGEGGLDDELGLLVGTFERGMAALASGVEEPAGEPGATERDHDLAALQRTLAASLESGLLLLDREGRVVALNPVGARLLGVEVPEPGQDLAAALSGHRELVELLAGAVAGRRPIQRHELTLQLPAGAAGEGRANGSLTLGLTVHPLRRGTGDGEKVQGFLVLFADLTEARRRGEEARLAENLVRLGELAAGVAHELRNSLATIRGYLALMERSPDEPPADYLVEVRREADHLQRVLEDFLSFARPGSARLENLSLVAVVRLTAADPALEGQAVEVVEELPAPGADRLRGDSQLLERAVRNLLRNAAEAQREAGAAGAVRVRVGCGPKTPEGGEEGVLLRVEDRGGGIPPEVADRLFHPFVTGRPGGVGLGLALAHRIVSLHGGNLRLDPRPGGGTRARVWLPAGRSVTEGSDPDSPAAPDAPPR